MCLYIKKEWVVNPLRLCFCCLVISVKPLANVVGDHTCSDRNYKVANKFHVLTSFVLVSLGNIINIPYKQKSYFFQK